MSKKPTHEELEQRIEELRENESQKQYILDASNDMIMQYDTDLRIVWANKKATSVINKTVSDILGYKRHKIFQGKDTPCPSCPCVKALQTGNVENEIMHLPAIETVGETYWDNYAVPIKDNNGQIIGITEIAHDITEHKQAEEALRESKKELSIINRVAEIFIKVPDDKMYFEVLQVVLEAMESPYGTFAYINEHGDRVVPTLTRDIWVECEVQDTDPVFPRERWSGIWGKCLINKEAVISNGPFRVSEGHVLIAKAMAIPIIHQEEAIGNFMVANKTTDYGEKDKALLESIADHLAPILHARLQRDRQEEERKRSEEQRRKMEAQLLEAQKMESIGTLAGGIAHQFNNALSGITGNIELLEMDMPNNKIVSNYTQQMKGSADRMIQLTAQLLAYARGGKYQANTTLINEFVENTLPLLQHGIDHSIKVETNLATDILNVNADSAQMQMVLSAILANASEAVEGEGLIRISTKGEEIDDEFVKHYPDLKPGPYVCLTVEDDGKGMDEETKSKIFEPFFTTKYQGRGLGMAAVYGIVKNHDGWVSVYSEIGRGTVVRIYLPAIESQIKKPEKPKVKLPKDAGTILLIEDEEKVMDVSRALSERLGYRVLGAMNGEAAVNIAKSYAGDIDLAILDIILPDIEGKEVYPQLKEVSPNLKVIVCSGYSIDGPAQEILDAGAQDFIQKPFTLTALSEKLKKALVAE